MGERYSLTSLSKDTIDRFTGGILSYAWSACIDSCVLCETSGGVVGGGQVLIAYCIRMHDHSENSGGTLFAVWRLEN